VQGCAIGDVQHASAMLHSRLLRHSRMTRSQLPSTQLPCQTLPAGSSTFAHASGSSKQLYDAKVPYTDRVQPAQQHLHAMQALCQRA
jgi:hypothetical protein